MDSRKKKKTSWKGLWRVKGNTACIFDLGGNLSYLYILSCLNFYGRKSLHLSFIMWPHSYSCIYGIRIGESNFCSSVAHTKTISCAFLKVLRPKSSNWHEIQPISPKRLNRHIALICHPASISIFVYFIMKQMKYSDPLLSKRFITKVMGNKLNGVMFLC